MTSARSGLPIFHPVGVLFFFSGLEPYLTQTLEVHRRLGIPIQELQKGELVRRFPQFSWDGIELGLYEPELGALMAQGKLKYRESIAQGIESSPRAFIGLLRGENFGKQLVKVG